MKIWRKCRYNYVWNQLVDVILWNSSACKWKWRAKAICSYWLELFDEYEICWREISNISPTLFVHSNLLAFGKSAAAAYPFRVSTWNSQWNGERFHSHFVGCTFYQKALVLEFTLRLRALQYDLQREKSALPRHRDQTAKKVVHRQRLSGRLKIWLRDNRSIFRKVTKWKTLAV